MPASLGNEGLDISDGAHSEALGDMLYDYINMNDSKHADWVKARHKKMLQRKEPFANGDEHVSLSSESVGSSSGDKALDGEELEEEYSIPASFITSGDESSEAEEPQAPQSIAWNWFCYGVCPYRG